MITADSPALARADAIDDAAARRLARRPRRVGLLRAGLGAVAAAALLVVGTVVLETPMWARVALVCAGAALAYGAVAALCHALIGPQVDVALWASVVWLGIVVGAAVFAPFLPIGEHADTVKTLTDPGYVRPDLFSEHPLGTNQLGLDELARVIYGARTSLTVALGAVLIAAVVGTTIGLVSGYLRGGVDLVTSLLTDTLLAFPPLILLLALATVMEPSIRNVTLALALLSTPTMIRLARVNTMVYAQREFVLVARAMGARPRRIIFRDLLPNVVPPVASYAMTIAAVLIIAEASLSFLGLGIRAPKPSWGGMIAEGQGGVIENHPHIVAVPGVVLFLTVAAFNVVGEKAKRRFAVQRTEV